MGSKSIHKTHHAHHINPKLKKKPSYEVFKTTEKRPLKAFFRGESALRFYSEK